LTLFSIRFETGLLLQCHFFGTNADIGTWCIMCWWDIIN
jgi:hypothetical protein